MGKRFQSWDQNICFIRTSTAWDSGLPEYMKCSIAQQNGACKELGLFWETIKFDQHKLWVFWWNSKWGMVPRRAETREVILAIGCCVGWDLLPFLFTLRHTKLHVTRQKNIANQFLKPMDLRCQDHHQSTNSRSSATLQDSRGRERRLPAASFCKRKL